MKENILKWINIFLAIVMIANLALVAFRVFSWRLFWIITIIVGIYTWWILPRIKSS